MLTPTEERELLNRLPRVVEAKFDPARCCLGETRRELIAEIVEWASNATSNRSRIFWLQGQAGRGKSTIATSLACTLNERGWLGASFFFSRNVASRSTPDHIFSTIAFQMSSLHPLLSCAICRAITADQDVGGSVPLNQFHKLIKEPLCTAQSMQMPMVILLDALDECGTEKDRKDILAIIHGGITGLPANVKFVITSRPEVEIRTSFTFMGNLVQSVNLDIIQRHFVDRDILTFVKVRMKDIVQSYQFPFHLHDWPGQERRSSLVRLADGLFVWISTACAFIEMGDTDSDDDPDARLASILSARPITIASPWIALDNLYTHVLEQAIPREASPARTGLLRDILGTILAAFNPLSASSLAVLRDMPFSGIFTPGYIIQKTLRKLHSVVVVPGSDVIQIIHPSFRDFLTNVERCTDARFYIDLKVYHHQFVIACLRRMQECLRRDICRVGHGPMMTSAPSDLNTRIATYIPVDLQYACRFWAHHLIQLHVGNEEVYGSLRKFVFEHLIHWVEVLSLINAFDSGILCLKLAQDWLEVM
jgi:hypothetical protein